MRPTLILTLLLLFPLMCIAQDQNSSGGVYPNADHYRPARIPIEGAKLFQHNCAECHGSDGRGHGPGALALKHTVPDLTLIAQRNGGKFPYERVREIIEGKQAARLAHGDQEMPVWGPIFHDIESDQDWGEVRLEAVTRQVESMQRNK
ncbi:MAG: cytochrome c [Candidatus Sulfotelmatobacter sp.]